MLQKILCKAVSVIRQMNQWWDKDEDKEISTVVSSIIILLAILILSKVALFIIAFIVLANRVAHRFNLWTNMEAELCELDKTVSSPVPMKEELEEDDLQ